MSEEQASPVEVTTAYLVVVQKTGEVSVFTSELPQIAVERIATLTDIEAYSLTVAAEANRELLAARLAPPPAATVADKVSAARARRKKEGD